MLHPGTAEFLQVHTYLQLLHTDSLEHGGVGVRKMMNDAEPPEPTHCLQESTTGLAGLSGSIVGSNLPPDLPTG
jgi:hypothetical protein